LFRLKAGGSLPQPVHISTNIIRWRWSDVSAYLARLPLRRSRGRDT
jgi:predicted DNA-binding transcriptional regulator AlpA